MCRSFQMKLIAVLMVGLAGQVCWGQQVTNGLNIGFPENGTFHGSSFDNVQLTNGNLHIEIPLFSIPGRGLNANYKYVYDNKGWYLKTTCGHMGICTDRVLPETGNNMGWTLSNSVQYQVTYQLSGAKYCTGVGGQVYLMRSNYVLRDPDGTKHTFRPDATNIPISGGTCSWFDGKLYATDGSGWIVRLNNSGFVTQAVSKSGSVVVAGSSVQDSNGNQILYDSVGLAWKDTLGRTLPNGLQYYDSAGNLQTIQTGTTTVTIQTSLCTFSGADDCIEYSGTWYQLSQLTLPNGMTYTFTYAQGAYGEPTSVTLPTGGQISWTWGGTTDSGRVVAARTLTEGSQASTWTYTGCDGINTVCLVRNPAVNGVANEVRHTFTWLGIVIGMFPYETKTEYFSGLVSGGQLIKTVQTDYVGFGGDTLTWGTWVPIRETSTWNQTNQVSKVETDWEYQTIQGGSMTFTATWRNPLQRREYAYGTGSPGGLVRKTTYTYLHQASTTYKNLNIADRVTSQITYDGAGAIKAQTTTSYDGSAPLTASGAPNHDYANFGTGYLTRGNPTSVSRWRNTDGAWLTTTSVYDELGNLRSTTDPGGHTTTNSYTDDWANSTCVPGGVNTQAYVTQVTNHLGHRAQTRYFPCMGLTQRTRDENDILAGRDGTTFTYDFMNRPVESKIQDATGVLSQTLFAYNTSPIWARAKKLRAPGAYIVSYAHVDQLGRVWRSELCEDGSDACGASIKTDTTFDALGQVWKVTNPYRTTSDATYGITETLYDALGRVTKVIPPDGTAGTNNITTAYSGNNTTVTDQAGKQRRSFTDALGRLIQVDEPNPTLSTPAVTTYTYDTLDNLLTVLQSGSRQRTFTYNSLSQLLTANNPESGAITYTYDSDGNLLTKVDARSITTTHIYDGLHRLNKKTYSDSTPLVRYAYDGLAYETCDTALSTLDAQGRRTAMCDGAGSESWAYDMMGRVATDRRTTNNVTKDFTYTYNEDSSSRTLAYPTGRTVTYTYDPAGRPTMAQDVANNINYATNGSYAPSGQRTYASLAHFWGSNAKFIGISHSYNNRLQPVAMSAGAVDVMQPGNNVTYLSLSYDFQSGVSNNGNVMGITNTLDSSRSQTFTYDALNRIESARTQASSGSFCWGLSFGYDIWANFKTAMPSIPGCPTESLNLTISTLNRISDSGYTYDSSGNLTANPATSATYQYDAESRMTSATTTLGSATYTYDGDGRRVKKGTAELYWYGMGADPLLESDAAGNVTDEFIFFGGSRIARRGSTGTVYYYVGDHLGSSRIIAFAYTNKFGMTGHTKCYEADYLPFGQERVITDTCPQPYKFTGKERDTESGLDFFIARYYSSQQGRFLSPDEFTGGPVDAFSSNDPLPPGPLPYADITNPQSLNKYTYTYNNPLRYTDPDGHCPPCTEAPPIEVVIHYVLSGGSGSGGGAAGGGAALGPVILGVAAVGGGALALYSSLTLYDAENTQTQVMAQVDKENRLRLHQQQQQQQEQQAQAEPEPSAEGGSRRGGGRDSRKQNVDRAASAKAKYEQVKAERDALAKKPNKTKEDKAKLEQLNRQVKHLQRKMQEKSETHARKEKGQQE